MIDPRLLNHPVNQLALACLKQAKAQPNPKILPILTFLLTFLDRLPRKAFLGKNNMLEELRAQVIELQTAPQEQVAALLVADYESLQADLEEESQISPWEVLSLHLDNTAESLRQCPSLHEAGRLLVEYLRESLKVASWGIFDLQSP